MGASAHGELDARKHEPEYPARFHLFPRLPTELQLLIWEMALCHDETPRIHYYSLFYTDREGHRYSQLQQMMSENPAQLKNPCCHKSNGGFPDRIVPDLKSQPDRFSWATSNRFEYLWDAGLQVACRDSRRVFFSHFSKHAGQQWKPHESQPKHFVRTYTQEPDAILHVPKDDIICLRFALEDIYKDIPISWEAVLTHLPMLRLPLVPDFNLALEFDRSWNDGVTNSMYILELMGERSPRGLALRLHWDWLHGRLPRAARMWLIDRDEMPLPDTYVVGRRGPYITRYGSMWYAHQPGFQHQSCQEFTDGRARYIESYSNADQFAPVNYFVWKTMDVDCTRLGYHHDRGGATYGQYFFNVLRLKPGSGDSGRKSKQPIDSCPIFKPPTVSSAAVDIVEAER